MSYLGSISAAALGYIHGGTKGAYLGAKAYGRFSSKKTMAPIQKRKRVSKNFPHTKRARIGPKIKSGKFVHNTGRKFAKPRTINTMQRNHRAVRKTIGRGKVKGIVHRKRSLKITRIFRKKVKKVVAGSQHFGTHYSVRQGTIGMRTINSSTATTTNTGAQGGYNDQVTFTQVPDEASSNCRCWFSTPLESEGGIKNGDEWQFFTPMKIIDAASVLWNQKVAANAYSTQTGNLNTVHNGSTGVQVVGTNTDMNISGLKINVSNAYVKMTLKNNCQRAMVIEVYKCVPTANNPNNLALTTFADAIDAEVDGTNTHIISTVGTGSHTGSTTLLNMPGVEPNQFAAFRSEWKYEKVSIKIAPGEVTSLFFQGPRDYLLDYDKLNKGGDSVQHLASRWTTMNVMMSVLPDLVFSTAGASGNPGQTGRFFQNQLALTEIVNPISIEWTEVYSLKMPDIVGFQHGAAADAGVMYTLNKRVHRRSYNNLVRQHSGDANPTYSTFDEENPGDSITGLNNRFN